MRMSMLGIALIWALAPVGCGGNELVGSWQTYVNAEGAPPVRVDMELRSDDTFTVASAVDFSPSGGLPVDGCTATSAVDGAWSATSSQLELTAESGTREMSACNDPAVNSSTPLDAAELADSSPTLGYSFVNPDLLRITNPDGSTNDFVRQ